MYFNIPAFVPLKHATRFPLLPLAVKVSDVQAFLLASQLLSNAFDPPRLTSPPPSFLWVVTWTVLAGMPSPGPVSKQYKFSSHSFPSLLSCSLAILNIYQFCAASFDFYRGSLCQQWICLIFLTLLWQLWSRQDPWRLSESSNSQRS